MNMIRWHNKEDDMWEGSFQSRILRNEANQPELFICIQNPDDADYAQQCVEHCNTLTDSVLDAICMGLMKCAAKGGMEEDFELPELDNVRDILQYCWFTTLYADNSGNGISYIAEGEGEWGEVIGFVIRGGELVYVGTEYFEA